MLKRIPHTDLAIISGKKKTKNYLEMQKRMGKFYFRDFLRKFDPIKRQGRYLEVGPGPGYQTVLIAARYKPVEIVGLESSADMIEVAEGYAQQKGMSETIKYINGIVEDADLINQLGKFNLIHSTFSLHYWNDPAKGIQNLFNALDKNGILFIYDFFRGGPLYYVNFKRGVWESIRASYRHEEIKQMLKELHIEYFCISRKGLYMNFIIKKN